MKKKIQKPFDAEAAKRGARVETRGGRSVRIVCHDRAGINYPIVALVNYQVSESCSTYTTKGELVQGETNEEDLVIIEEIEVSKFNPGDWLFAINGGGHPWLITAITPNYYEVQINTQELKEHVSRITVDNYFRLWTLDDARPGDVLVCKNDDHPFIFKGCIDEAHPGYPVAFCGINCNDEFASDTRQNWWTDSSVRPATYEERQLLFNKLKEEGYKWDTDTLTLSKIQKRWRDNEYKTISGYYIYIDSRITYSQDHSNTKENYNIFATEKQAKSALAMAQISQIMANDERFGGAITNEEWMQNYGRWYVIIRIDTTLEVTLRVGYEYLAFHTREQAKLFLEENRDLVKDYYMMD